MANFEIIMPKMGESIEEATITRWFVNEGDNVDEEDVLLEIATDKVDSEIPSPVDGVVKKIMYKQDETVPVGSVIAIIDTEGDSEEAVVEEGANQKTMLEKEEPVPGPLTEEEDAGIADQTENKEGENEQEKESRAVARSGERFYSPLVRKIAREENVSQKELDKIQGSGLNGRVQKKDILGYLEQRSVPQPEVTRTQATEEKATPKAPPVSEAPGAGVSISAQDEIIQMDRMRKIIAEHMIRSKQVSAHVTNMLEADVTTVVNWRNRIKDDFQKREGIKITYLPVFLEAATKALKDFPLINSSVDGDRIIVKKKINMGVAVSLPNNNLIVPVIKNIDSLNLLGITQELNRLANAARSNSLKPEEIQDGTFTVTNFGSFRNTIGTPIINQPQVAILAIGAVEKKPAVLETAEGDVIAIRHKMFLSLTYDHRIIDGSLGGSYLRKAADYIENFDINRTV